MAKTKAVTRGSGKTGRSAAYQDAGGNLGKMWKTAKDKVATTPSPFANVDDGLYAAFLKKCASSRDDQNRLVVDWGFVIAKGDAEGQKTSRRTYLATQENFEWFLRDLQRLEVDIADLEIKTDEDLESICEELQKAGLVIRIRLKTGDAGYQNVFFQKLLERDAEAPAEATAGDAGGEAAPEDAGGDGGEDAEAAMKAWVGKQAAFKKGKVVLTGKITKVDTDTEQFTMKTNEDKTVTGDVEALEEIATGEDAGGEAGEAGEGEAELQVGDTVEFENKGKTLSGKVIRIADDGTTAKVLVVGKTGKVKMEVKIEDMVIVR